MPIHTNLSLTSFSNPIHNNITQVTCLYALLCHVSLMNLKNFCLFFPKHYTSINYAPKHVLEEANMPIANDAKTRQERNK